MSKLYKDVTKILKLAGCENVRDGKGSHEVWQSPITQKRFPVARTISSTTMANIILHQAGLPKVF